MTPRDARGGLGEKRTRQRNSRPLAGEVAVRALALPISGPVVGLAKAGRIVESGAMPANARLLPNAGLMRWSACGSPGL